MIVNPYLHMFNFMRLQKQIPSRPTNLEISIFDLLEEVIIVFCHVYLDFLVS